MTRRCATLAFRAAQSLPRNSLATPAIDARSRDTAVTTKRTAKNVWRRAGVGDGVSRSVRRQRSVLRSDRAWRDPRSGNQEYLLDSSRPDYLGVPTFRQCPVTRRNIKGRPCWSRFGVSARTHYRKEHPLYG